MLVGIYLEKTKTLNQKDTFTPMLKAALFTVAKTWKQPRCARIDKWIRKTHTHTQEQYSVIKSKILSFAATWMGLKKHLSEVKQRKINII